MTPFYALIAVGVLILLIARFKVHPFVALVAVSLGMGAAAGMTPGTLLKAFQDGVGFRAAFSRRARARSRAASLSKATWLNRASALRT